MFLIYQNQVVERVNRHTSLLKEQGYHKEYEDYLRVQEDR